MDDRISSLPDEILCYILSFLPTKQAVASSVLSKRWIFLWRSVSSFDFCSTDFDFDINKGESHFIRSVESFLDRRDRDQPLHKFSLRLPFSHFVASDNGRLGLLNLYLDKHCPIPLLKFCKTLVVLKLTNLSLEDNFSVDLPLLKILHLNEVDLPDCLDLVFRCPNLEDLELNFMQCAIKGKTNMFTKLVRLSINDGYCPLKIFNYVQVLTFDLWFQSNLDLGFVFHNLVQLEMDFRPRNDWLRVFEVLKYSPKLQSLVICIHPNSDSPCYEEDVWPYPEDVWPYPEDVWPYPETVPACISSHLKTCSLIYYSGYKGDFHFARYILENAKYLRTMRIRIGQRNGNDIMERELSSCMKIRYLHPLF